ncbi:methyltransferase domain-containing protein [Sphingomonas koreensis]|nr:methyltransferase domain-containing protein [Sphingomonas koreensis]
MTEASDWTGAVGDVWAAEWRRTDRSFVDFAPNLDTAILAAAPPGAGKVLDIGCGAGATSIALARARPDLAITGVDLSAGLLAVARQRAAGLQGAADPSDGPGASADAPGLLRSPEKGDDPVLTAAPLGTLSFAEGDAVAAAGHLAPIDLFVSRHGVMFFDDPVRAFAALHAAAAPGAALVFSCFRATALNPWMAEIVAAATGAPPAPRDDAPGPFAFADESRVATILANAGWIDARATPIDYTYHAGAGADPVGDAVSFFSRIGPSAPILRALLADQREATLARIAEVCERHRQADAIDFPAAAWIWSARA